MSIAPSPRPPVAAPAPYYRRRASASVDYSDYWGVKTDPDGVVRDRIRERDQFLADIADERRFLAELPPGRILDYGAGLGWLLDSLDEAWEKWALEIAPQALAALESLGIRAIEQPEDAPSESFDAVVCHHVIEHCDEPEETLAHIARMLVPRGHLLMATPDFDSPCAKRFGENYRMLHDVTHVSLFTNESMHRFLRDFGFRIDRVEYPFPERYATPENLLRWNDTSRVSPPWPGNWMTFYCTKE